MKCIQIYNVLLLQDEIIGIGPLRRLTRPNDAASIAARAASFQFEVYTRSVIVTVSTDELSFWGEAEKTSKDEYTAIKLAWDQVKEILLRSAIVPVSNSSTIDG